MQNWAMEHDRKDEEKREKELNDILNELLHKEERIKCNTIIDRKELIDVLKKIINIYRILKLESFDYNEESLANKESELQQINCEILRESYNQDKGSDSWNKYREEEEGR